MGGGQSVELDDGLLLALFRVLTENVEGHIKCIDRQRRTLFINRTITRDLPHVLGKRLDDFLSEPQRAAAIECTEQAFSSRSPQQLELSAVLADGKRYQLLLRVVPFLGPRGEEVALQITTDITERRRLVAELHESVEMRRRIVEHLPDFLSVMDREYRFIWQNRFIPTLPPEQVLGKTLADFLTPAEAAKAHAAFEAAFVSGTTQNYEVEGFGEGNVKAWYAVRVVPISTEGVTDSLLLITTDITERRRAEQALREKDEQLHQAQRLESLGQLAGGIAHDFNNLLQVIEGNLSFVREGMRNGELPLEDLEQAMRAAERAGELTAHLLAIGRRSRVVPQRVELGQHVEQWMRLLRRVIPENVKLVYEPPAADFFVAIDPPRFEQVLINLCVNSRDAMPDGGVLAIVIEPDGEHHVVMKVADTGSGIAPENLGRIFEPFFTTKGTGSGLGLAVAAGIVAIHGGDITAHSDGRHGTTIAVRLPRVKDRVEQEPPSTDTILHGSGVILIAEDEALVRTQVMRILTSAGYTVLQAENGVQAVELFRKNAANIELVLLDVVMPELNGWQAYQLIVTMKPEVRVLFTTGYAANVLPPDFAARGARLLSKPYKRQHLLAQVRDLLSKPLLA